MRSERDMAMMAAAMARSSLHSTRLVMNEWSIFKSIDREVAQPPEARVAGAEVVDRQQDAELLQLVERLLAPRPRPS